MDPAGRQRLAMTIERAIRTAGQQVSPLNYDARQILAVSSAIRTFQSVTSVLPVISTGTAPFAYGPTHSKHK
jgi:hypothetical protein